MLSILSWQIRRHRKLSPADGTALTKRWNVRWLWMFVLCTVTIAVVLWSQEYFTTLGTSEFMAFASTKSNGNETETSLTAKVPEALTSLNLEQTLDLEGWHPCGQHKCFFVSKHQQNQDYVIGSSTMLSPMTHGWKLAQRFRLQYNITHPWDPQTPPFVVQARNKSL